MFSGCTSLLKSPELPSKILADGCYAGMFYGCTGLKDAPNLPASTLAEKCYADMFSGCTGLTKAPLLPAKTLEKNCYNAMFMNCTMLADAPTLPATGLAQGCYSNMFNGCTGLTKTPNLSSRKLAKDCYNAMFMNCTNLTTVTLLPAFVVEDGCYNSMFMNCSNLINAPMLPATTLKNNCYANMFRGCSKLSSINCMAKDISATDCTKMWLDGVASAGKFVASAGTSWPSGTSGIPSGWTRDGEPLSCSDGVHPHMIDLGLPSGTKWACCNVGASKPEDYGSYYAWGEVVEKSTYTWASYSHGSSEDVVDFIGADIVGTIYDAAKHNWEASWQMPSEKQVTELLTNTSWEWTTVSGINGVKLTSQNGKYIFIPTAGMHSGDMKYEVSSLGYYWTSTQYEGGQSLAYTLYIGNDYMHRGVDYRYLGHSVRPVSK